MSNTEHPRNGSLDEGGEPSQPSGAVYSVGQLTSFLKETLEANPALSDLWVTGEVSNHHRAGSGHNYFSLRDADGVMRCVMFRPGRGASFLADGAQVLAHGRVSFYTARGDLQFYVDIVKPEGLGALQQAFEEMRRRLAEEGLFEPSRKRALPSYPRRIAVVTSPDAAALQDVLNVLGRRYPLAEVLIAPTLVQGDAAAPGIVSALAAVGETPGIDVVIVTRGGGSLEDLWPFNEETVARAIFSCPVPVVSAVGHETDVTIADLVADVRAPTPSAAAEIVVPDRADLLARTSGYVEMIAGSARALLGERRLGLDLAVDRLGERAPDTRAHRERIDALLRSARLALGTLLDTYRVKAGALEAELRALGPAQILARGYAVVRRGPDGPVLASAGDVSPGDPLDITLADGHVEAETRASHPNP